MLTTPTSTRTRLPGLALLLAMLAAITPLAFLVDIPLARWALTTVLPGDLQNLIKLSEVFAHGSGVLLILLAAAALDPRSWRVLPRLALGAYGAGLLADLLKFVLARRRPEAADVMNIEVWGSFQGIFAWQSAATWQEALSRDNLSFPSGHAATAAGLACAMTRLYPRAAWFFVGMTLLACFQRIAFQAHYLSDVLAGAAVGVLFSLLLELPRWRDWLAAIEQVPTELR